MIHTDGKPTIANSRPRAKITRNKSVKTVEHHKTAEIVQTSTKRYRIFVVD